MIKVWMNVDSANYGVNEQRLGVRYVECIDKIVVSVGSGRLFMESDIAEQLHQQLGEQIIDAKLAAAAKSGEGVWVSPTTFVSPDEVARLRSERGAA